MTGPTRWVTGTWNATYWPGRLGRTTPLAIAITSAVLADVALEVVAVVLHGAVQRFGGARGECAIGVARRQQPRMLLQPIQAGLVAVAVFQVRQKLLDP